MMITNDDTISYIAGVALVSIEPLTNGCPQIDKNKRSDHVC
jgi:hypothetical protein